MSEIKLSGFVVDVDGDPLKDDKGRNLTMIRACMQSVVSQGPNEKIEADEKYKRYILFKKLGRSKDGSVDLDLDERKKIKDLVGIAYGALVMGQIWDVLDPKEEKSPSEVK